MKTRMQRTTKALLDCAEALSEAVQVRDLDAVEPLLARRPLRAPHHTISDAGLVGGGSTRTPGEMSLSHNGVLLVLDELFELNGQTLEVIRQPLEDGDVTISRALHGTTFPTDFALTPE